MTLKLPQSFHETANILLSALQTLHDGLQITIQLQPHILHIKTRTPLFRNRYGFCSGGKKKGL